MSKLVNFRLADDLQALFDGKRAVAGLTISEAMAVAVRQWIDSGTAEAAAPPPSTALVVRDELSGAIPDDPRARFLAHCAARRIKPADGLLRIMTDAIDGPDDRQVTAATRPSARPTPEKVQHVDGFHWRDGEPLSLDPMIKRTPAPGVTQLREEGIDVKGAARGGTSKNALPIGPYGSRLKS